MLPRYKRDTVWTLVVIRSRPGGSFAAGILALCIASSNDVVYHVVPTDPCSTVATRVVDATTFHLLHTGTEMRIADADVESHFSGDPDGLVRHS